MKQFLYIHGIAQFLLEFALTSIKSYIPNLPHCSCACFSSLLLSSGLLDLLINQNLHPHESRPSFCGTVASCGSAARAASPGAARASAAGITAAAPAGAGGTTALGAALRPAALRAARGEGEGFARIVQGRHNKFEFLDCTPARALSIFGEISRYIEKLVTLPLT